MLEVFCIAAAVAWVGVLLLPFRPWRTREHLEGTAAEQIHGDDLTVLIPARNEEEYIERTIAGVLTQAAGVHVVVIDDRSKDETAAIASRCGGDNVQVLSGKPRPDGWSGKLWALQQGLHETSRPWVLLLDADIVLRPGILAALRQQTRRGYDLVSLMARLPMNTFWSGVMAPAFIYFFKLLYPFRLVAHPKFWGAAAGGCVLVRRQALLDANAFDAWRGTLIDDCALGRHVKRAGYRTWLGLTHDVVSQRACGTLTGFWQMIARTAYPQLQYSPWLLMVCTGLMGVMFVAPLVGLFAPTTAGFAGLALGAMFVSYVPTVRYYRLPIATVLSLPIVASLYLVITWSSALQHWVGQGSQWKGRAYISEGT